MLMKIPYLLLLCFLNFQVTVSQTLSPTAEISVLTIDPGTSLNDAFGHSGFRIKDNTQGIDEVYARIFNDTPSTPIVKNILGDSAGVIGAALIGRGLIQ